MKIEYKDVVIDMNPIQQILADRGLQDYGPVQKFLDKRIIEQSDSYAPGSSQTESAMISTEFGSGEIVYNTPQSHYLYEGVLYVDPITGKGAFFSENYGFWSRPGVQKIPSDRELQYHGGGNRGKKWVERMWIDKKNEIVDEVQAKVDRRGN